ncbi:MAG: lytic murein transglycosylase [Burkholderiaceae bacterium]
MQTSGAVSPGPTTQGPLAASASSPQPSPSGTPPSSAAPSTSGVATAPAASDGSAQAATEAQNAALAQAFAQWVSNFTTAARAAGINDATLHAAFDTVQYLPRVVDLDLAQPEFTRTIWDYLDVAVSPRRIAQGQDKLLTLPVDAADAATRYGVPANIVVAIWGMESNYGANCGDIPTIDALTTLGFEGRREDWARGQLLAALKILQSGDITRANMLGSWAGAMGQTQFLPSNYLTYAVDADGDGHRDIWGSLPDVMASTANLLARAGWRTGQPWGAEVQLPSGFDYGQADSSVRQSSELWAALGVQSMDGAPLPAFSDGSILLPAGARGPAFLVGPNFRVILRYNNATSYALAVGLLAQQIAGGSGVQAAWPRDMEAPTRSALLTLQTILNQRGFASGTPDGIMGPATRAGIRAFQRSVGLPADGYPDPDLLRRLLGQPAPG